MAKVLVTMPQEFLSKIDKVANDENRTRSELIREALRTYMRKVSPVQAKSASKNAKTLEHLIG